MNKHVFEQTLWRWLGTVTRKRRRTYWIQFEIPRRLINFLLFDEVVYWRRIRRFPRQRSPKFQSDVQSQCVVFLFPPPPIKQWRSEQYDDRHLTYASITLYFCTLHAVSGGKVTNWSIFQTFTHLDFEKKISERWILTQTAINNYFVYNAM